VSWKAKNQQKLLGKIWNFILMQKKRMLKAPQISKDLFDSLNRFKKEHAQVWEEKYRVATKRLLSSIFYFVSAKRCYQRENRLLSAIGYYYSIFHMSKALLFLHPKYSEEDLKGIPHRKVFNLIKSDFIQTKMLSRKYGETLYYFRKVREGVSYGMDRWITLGETLEDGEPKLLSCIEEAISLFKEICNEEIGHISAIIGDGIGDDWMDSYLSEDESQEVIEFLLKHNLTT
jgi:uncharacterized protein (UPF0332 family)